MSHRIGKFNILSVNVILFQGNRKYIRVGLSGRNNPDSGLLTKKIREISGLSGRLKAQCLVTHGCFPKKLIIFEIYVLIPNLSWFEKFCFLPYGREVWKARFESCLCILPSHCLCRRSANWPWISVDVAVTINQCLFRISTSKAQVLKTVKFSMVFIQRS